jgi:membrane-bound acyltransferase YfiQ involved in biofilm formation
VAAIGGWLVLASTELVWPGKTIAPHWAWTTFQIAHAVESWCAIIALIGMADFFVNADHRWRPMLAEAVFPFYLIHQTIIVVAGYALLSSATGPLARFAILLVVTVMGCWAFYLVGRRIDWLRPAIGLSRRGSDNFNRTSKSSSKLARS